MAVVNSSVSGFEELLNEASNEEELLREVNDERKKEEESAIRFRESIIALYNSWEGGEISDRGLITLIRDQILGR